MTIFFLLGMFLSFLGGKKVNTVYVVGNEVITLTDTLIRKEVLIEHAPAKIETLWVKTESDTVVLTEVASIDTLLGEDGRLKIRYYTQPRLFDINWQPFPLEIRCKQLVGGEISLSNPIDDVVKFGIGAGLGQRWDKRLHASIILGVDIYDNSAYIMADEKGWTVGYMRKFGGF